jgi:hypothetical protein
MNERLTRNNITPPPQSKNLDACHKELRTIIGENEATSTIVAIYNEKVQ